MSNQPKIESFDQFPNNKTAFGVLDSLINQCFDEEGFDFEEVTESEVVEKVYREACDDNSQVFLDAYYSLETDEERAGFIDSLQCIRGYDAEGNPYIFADDPNGYKGEGFVRILVSQARELRMINRYGYPENDNYNY
jgi:hypothetical protein